MRYLVAALAAISLALLASAAHAATPPRGAFTYVGNVDDGARSGVVDKRNFVNGKSSTIRTALDGGDDMTTGDVLGDGFDELVVADDGTGRIDIHDTGANKATSFGTSIGQDVNLYDDVGDDITTGNIVGDAKDEIIVASTRFDLIIVYSSTGEELKRLSVVNFDDDDRIVAGDFFPDRAHDEIAVVNSEDEGRIDYFDGDRNKLRTEHSGYDGDGDDVAAGDDTGDLVEEVIIANDEGGRIESVDLVADKTHTTDSAYDSDDKLGAGDVTGDGKAEALIANTENNRVDVINFFGKGGNFGSAYDSDDRFAVGNFGSGDIDGDAIPDRVELLGIRNGKGELRFDLKARGASPCRKDVVIEVDHMAGIDPNQSALENVVATFAKAKEVKPVANCPYADVSTAEGINLIIDQTDPKLQGTIPHEATVSGREAADALIAKHFDLKLPFVRYSMWIDNYEVKRKDNTVDSPAGQAGRGAFDLDFLVALDGDTDPKEHEATFIHELGHSLGLDHGGETDDLVNCKPNYLSVMNYAFRGGLPELTANTFRFDFSHQALPELDEAKLDEGDGIGGSGDLKTLWTNGKGNIATEIADRDLDWNGNGNNTDDDVPVDLNRRDPLDLTGGAPCEEPNDNQAGLQKLGGHNDWDLLNRQIAGPNSVKASENEPTVEQIRVAFENRDQVFFPDAAVQLRPQKPGFTGDSLGVAMDANHIYALHNYRVEGVPSPIDGNGVLVMLDRDSLAQVAQIPVGPDARSVAVNPVTSRAYVVNRGTGAGSSLSVINTATRKPIKTISLGQVGIDVAVNTKLNRVYVSNPAQEDIQVINGATNTLLAPVQVGKGLVGMAVDETTNTIYVAMTHRSSDPQFTALGRVVDKGFTREVLPQVDLGDPGIQANDVAVDVKRNRIYVGALGGGTIAPTVTVLDRTTMQEIARMPMPGPVRAIGINSEAGIVLASGDRGVEVIDAGQLKITRHIDAGLPFSVATENGPAAQLYVGDLRDGQLRRFSYTSGEKR